MDRLSSFCPSVKPLIFAGLASALPLVSSAQTAGFESATTSLPTGAAALAYGPDGTLFVASGGASTGLLVIDPTGNQTTLELSGGVTLDSVGGAAFDPSTGNLLVTDNEAFGDGLGNLISIDPVTGATQTLLSGIDTIDDVAVRSTGEVFISDAAGSTDGTVRLVNTDGTTTTVVDGLGFTAGLDFTAAGDLVFQNVDASTFAGSVSQLSVTQDTGGLTFGPVALLASDVAGFDLAIDSEDDIFVTGSGGLFELDRTGSGEFTGSASLLKTQGFSTEIDFLAGDVPFEAFGELNGGVSGQLTFVPGFGATSLTTLTVPEPSVAALLGLGLITLSARRRREVQA